MNKGRILDYLINKKDNLSAYKELMEEMEAAKEEINIAHSMFNNVNDDTLIEVAIYSENVARKRYDYLLSLARKKGIKVDYDYILEKSVEVAE